MPSRVVRARLDDAAERGLATLTSEGRNESDAIRTALIEAGQRRLRGAELAAEVERLNTDDTDLDERFTVMADMDSVSSEWPE